MDTRVNASDSQILRGGDNSHKDSWFSKPRVYAATTGLLLSVTLFMYPKPKYVSLPPFRQPINIVRPIKAVCAFAAGITFVLACTSAREAAIMESKPMES